MEPALLALGVTLLVLSLVPLLYGQFVRGAALAHLGAVSWGGGFGGSAGTLLLLGVSMTVLFGLVALGIVATRRLGARFRRAAGT